MMEENTNRDREREAQRALEIARLHQFEHDAVLSGTKLGPRDRLKAAYHLTRAWNAANKAGLRKEDFQDVIHARLKRQHKSRGEFRLTNWTLLRGEDPFKEDLTVKYTDKKTGDPTAKPQKALEQYFVGIAVAAEHCDVDPDDWKLDMLRDLTIWSRPTARLDVAPQDDRPAETLAILLNAMCANLARKNQLGDTFQAIRDMSCRWEMFDERLIAVTDATNCMEAIDSPISPVCEDGVYFEEMFPFPSIPLLYVPYLVTETDFVLAPEAMLRSGDAERMENDDYLYVGAPMSGIHGNHYNVPENAPDLRRAAGKLIWSREIRLCLVPDGHDGFAPAIESRPRVEVEFDEETPFAGRHHVIGGYEPSLDRGLFYARAEDGGHVWPHIHDQDGQLWRLRLAAEREDESWSDTFIERDPETTGWCFDPDPVGLPGDWSNEPCYISYTPATAPYLRHWLAKDWRLGGEFAVCPWTRSNFDTGEHQNEWSRNLPPIHELNFPDSSSATWIECCLHNGLIEKALQSAVDNLKQHTGELQVDWHHAREWHSNALLRRWKNDTKKGEIDL
jgi:hypothetical protein